MEVTHRGGSYVGLLLYGLYMEKYGSSEIGSENFIRGYIGGIGKCRS